MHRPTLVLALAAAGACLLPGPSQAQSDPYWGPLARRCLDGAPGRAVSAGGGTNGSDLVLVYHPSGTPTLCEFRNDRVTRLNTNDYPPRADEMSFSLTRQCAGATPARDGHGGYFAPLGCR
jgi:hypothetical protein